LWSALWTSVSTCDPNGDPYGSALIWRGDATDDVEQYAAFVHACQPSAVTTRTRKAIQFAIERPDCTVTLVVPADVLEFRLPTVDWPGPHSPVATNRRWKRVPWILIGKNRPAPQAILAAAFQKRRSEFVPCPF
jgi:hypothetical protein